jgi:plastocyanin
VGVNHRILIGIAAFAILATACGRTDEVELAQAEVRSEVFGIDDAPTDASLPSVTPAEPTGALGFDRYVWMRGDDGEVVPVMVEGPRDGGRRCQSPEDTCSYLELKALQESGSEIPDHLGLTADELDALVDELDQTAAAVAALSDIDDACAAGYMPVSAVNPNMGIHMTNPAFIGDGFDPGKPEMLLFSSEDAFGLTRTELGACEDGRWGGVPGLQAVGAAFFVEISDDHPEGFTGDFDNWHVHFNSCAGAELDNLGSRTLCDQRDGMFFEVQPYWMMHAYVVPGFDSQTGVFAMWNDSIWPTSAEVTGAEQPTPADETSTIYGFTFESMTIDAGDTVAFANADQVPHTVSAGTPGELDPVFNSGLVPADGTYSVTLDEPGDYTFFCELHPAMQASILVQ